MNLKSAFGEIDIYLFDQLLRGRIGPGMRVLDAGCGTGRNIVFLLQNGCDVSAVDADADAISTVRGLAARLAPALPPGQFRVEAVEALSFEEASFDAVISSAVLHFARDERHFDAMLRSMWRVLRAGGLLFARLASTVGLEGAVHPLGGRRFRLPDGTDRFLVDEPMLAASLEALGGGRLLDPLKTTVVHGQRSMTTWVVHKP